MGGAVAGLCRWEGVDQHLDNVWLCPAGVRLRKVIGDVGTV